MSARITIISKCNELTYPPIMESINCRDAEEQAEKIASEIENQPAYKERADLENGDEEARFAAVERPRSDSPEELKANSGKYVAPGRRKNTQTGKLIRSSLPLVSFAFSVSCDHEDVLNTLFSIFYC